MWLRNALEDLQPQHLRRRRERGDVFEEERNDCGIPTLRQLPVGYVALASLIAAEFLDQLLQVVAAGGHTLGEEWDDE